MDKTKKPHKRQQKSIVILNLNNGTTLDRSLERLWKEEDIEIIILDNHSQDNTKEVLDKWCIPEHYPRLRAWRWKVIKGQSTNRNFGFKKARGRFIMFLDSDILYYPGSFDYLVKRFETAPKNVKCIGFDPWGYTNDITQEATQLPSPDVPLSYRGQPIALTQYGVFKKELFSRYKIKFDEKFGTGYGAEDNDYALQMLQKGLKVASIPFRYYHDKHTSHWWSLHTPEFMRIKERQEYFINKWGRDAYERYCKMGIRKTYDQAVATKLFEDGIDDDIKGIPPKKRKQIEEYLRILELYKQKNPKKYEQKRQETIRKLNYIIYDIQ